MRKLKIETIVSVDWALPETAVTLVQVIGVDGFVVLPAFVGVQASLVGGAESSRAVVGALVSAVPATRSGDDPLPQLVRRRRGRVPVVQEDGAPGALDHPLNLVPGLLEENAPVLFGGVDEETSASRLGSLLAVFGVVLLAVPALLVRRPAHAAVVMVAVVVVVGAGLCVVGPLLVTVLRYAVIP